MLWGVELVKDRATKERVDAETVQAFKNARRGVLVPAIGATVRIGSPLVLTDTLTTTALRLLDEALMEAMTEP